MIFYHQGFEVDTVCLGDPLNGFFIGGAKRKRNSFTFKVFDFSNAGIFLGGNLGAGNERGRQVIDLLLTG